MVRKEIDSLPSSTPNRVRGKSATSSRNATSAPRDDKSPEVANANPVKRSAGKVASAEASPGKNSVTEMSSSMTKKTTTKTAKATATKKAAATTKKAAATTKKAAATTKKAAATTKKAAATTKKAAATTKKAAATTKKAAATTKKAAATTKKAAATTKKAAATTEKAAATTKKAAATTKKAAATTKKAAATTKKAAATTKKAAATTKKAAATTKKAAEEIAAPVSAPAETNTPNLTTQESEQGPARPNRYRVEMGGGYKSLTIEVDGTFYRGADGHAGLAESGKPFEVSYLRSAADLHQAGEIERVEMYYRINGGEVLAALLADGQRDPGTGALVREVGRVDIPANTRGELEYWFRLITTDGRVLWDSDFGRNHRAEILDSSELFVSFDGERADAAPAR